MAPVSFLECTRCGARISAERAQTTCPEDGGVLYARYNLEQLKHHFKPEVLGGRPANMWRYAEVLPQAEPVSLGEGFTPILPARASPNVFVKDEGLNPTGSFKARGLSAAGTMATAYGLQSLVIPSPGTL